MKKTLFLLTLFLAFFIVTSYAQSGPSIVWRKTIVQSDELSMANVIKTLDSNYILLGSTNANINTTINHGPGSSDISVVKTDTAGNVLWSKLLGGTLGEIAHYIKQTNDSGYIIAASSESVNGNLTGNKGKTDAWIIKLDKKGTIVWQKNYGGSSYDAMYFIQPTNDGGFITAGSSFSNDGDVTGHHGNAEQDFWVLKVNSKGELEWQKSYGGSNFDVAQSIWQTPDNGFMLFGITASIDGDVTTHTDVEGTNETWVLKLNSTGSIEWQKCIKKTYGSILSTRDGGYILAGKEATKLDDQANIQWSNYINFFEAVYAEQTSDDGYIVGGSFVNNETTTGTDYYLKKFDSHGHTQWQDWYLIDNGNDQPSCITESFDKGYVILGLANANDEENHLPQYESFVKLKQDRVLPLSLTRFAAILQKKDVVVNWQTNTELNTACFNLERSIDGNRFYTISKIKATGNSSTLSSYTFIDTGVASLLTPVIYYRLKQVDKNNMFTYSKIAAINIPKANNTLVIWPNPATSRLNITADNYNGLLTAIIYNAYGVQVRMLTKQMQPGTVMDINAASFAPGVYFISTIVNGQRQTYKFIKN